MLSCATRTGTEEQVVGRGGFKLGIEVGIRPCVLNGVIRKCLVKVLSITTIVAPRQGAHKTLNFRIAILQA